MRFENVKTTTNRNSRRDHSKDISERVQKISVLKQPEWVLDLRISTTRLLLREKCLLQKKKTIIHPVYFRMSAWKQLSTF